jgi:hypothetical protein
MGKIKVKNGTPVGNTHLCRGCTHGQFIVGYRETDVLVVCTYSNPARVVPFPVYECTEYWDRNRPSYDEMTKLALNFNESRRKPIAGFCDSGFAQLPVVASGDCEDDEDEAAITR